MQILLPLLVLALPALACGIVPTPTLVPAVKGTLEPWTDDTPIAGRHIVACQIVKEGECALMESAVTSNDQGEFEIYGMPRGEYFFLYDSGLSDFDEAMERWGGQVFGFFDSEWLNEYFGLYAPPGEWVEFHVPEGVSITDTERLFAYCQFSLMLGKSPFVLAHVIGQEFQDNRVLEPVTVDIAEGQTSQVEFQVVYYGE
jgi:hypothetical protein